MGTVFGLAPPSGTGHFWRYQVLYSFGAIPRDGSTPYAGLTLGPQNVLYGTTYAGGAEFDGTVFQLAPTGNGEWVETILYSFGVGVRDGFRPVAPVLLHNGALFGTTSEGGGGQGEGYGTVWRLLK